MAGLHTTLRPTSSSSSPPPPPPSSFHSHLLRLLTALSFSLAAFAFVLQWRGELPNPISHLPPDYHEFLGMAQSRPIPPPSFSSHCADTLGQSHMPSFPYYRNLKFTLEPGSGSDHRTKVCITTTTSAGLEQILPWLFYHKVVGVTNFFLFVEAKAASINVSKVLESIPGVKVIKRTRELEARQAESRIWNETWLDSFFYKPCNFELFVKQSLNMEMAIIMAREAGMDWIVHLDTDELLHPAGTSDYSVQRLLSDMPENVDLVVFSNYESCIERDDIKEPFSEVSMFKKGFDHLSNETYFGSYYEATRGNPDYFLTYGNGKSAARIQDHLRPNGAHRWSNYMKSPNEIYSDEAAVLHYTYAKFSDLTSRRDRCRCKPTEEDVKRCFILAFDRNAFIIASTLTEEEMLFWYHEHVVWTDKELTNKLLKNGILTRIYAPMIIVQGLREAGIFASVISSAWSNLSNDTFSLSTEHDNVSSKNPLREISSRNVGHTEAQDRARNVLKFAGTPNAIPPQSPPRLDDMHPET